MYRYDERLSKNYRASIKRFQEEQFRPAVYSYDPDVILTWMTLEAHYPPVLKKNQQSHLFLSPIDAPLTPVWFKVKEKKGIVEGMNLGVNQIRRFLKLMAEEAGVQGDAIMNKSGRVTGISRMAIAGVPKNVMAECTGHRALSSLDKYDETIALDVQAAQLVARIPYNVNSEQREHLTFDHYKKIVTEQYHKSQIGKTPESTSAIVSGTDVAKICPSGGGAGGGHPIIDKDPITIVSDPQGGFKFQFKLQVREIKLFFCRVVLIYFMIISEYLLLIIFVCE